MIDPISGTQQGISAEAVFSLRREKGAFPREWFATLLLICFAACSSDESPRRSDVLTDAGPVAGDDRDAGALGGSDAAVLTAPTCAPASGGGASSVATPTLWRQLSDAWHEGWLASPALVDLDGDGKLEVVSGRDTRLVVWNVDGSVRWSKDVAGRIWAPPVVGDLRPEQAGQEVAAAVRSKIYAWDANGNPLAGFPVTFRDEMRSLAAGDIDGDGRLELVAVTTSAISSGGQSDIVIAFNDDGSVVDGFPPNTTGTSGCDDQCYVTGGYDQNVALGDVDGDGKLDILAPQDNAYVSLHHGSGVAFDASPIFQDRKKFAGIRFLLDYALAQQGWADNEQTANQAHFTNTAPAIADIDGDGIHELVLLSSVQNAAQTDRERGVALWVVEHDGTRTAGWESPLHLPDYLAGLVDFEGTNVVAATNQVTVADIDSAHRGPELIFAGFDGRIHVISADREELWRFSYTTDSRVLTGGVVVADLSGDGVPEVVFTSYSPDAGKGALFVLDAAGQQLHRISLPGRGAMGVPSVADLDHDGSLEIVVDLKDGAEGQPLLLVYTVPGSATNCLPWPTGRGTWLRNGYVP